MEGNKRGNERENKLREENKQDKNKSGKEMLKRGYERKENDL